MSVQHTCASDLSQRLRHCDPCGLEWEWEALKGKGKWRGHTTTSQNSSSLLDGVDFAVFSTLYTVYLPFHYCLKPSVHCDSPCGDVSDLETWIGCHLGNVRNKLMAFYQKNTNYRNIIKHIQHNKMYMQFIRTLMQSCMIQIMIMWCLEEGKADQKIRKPHPVKSWYLLRNWDKIKPIIRETPSSPPSYQVALI